MTTSTLRGRGFQTFVRCLAFPATLNFFLYFGFVSNYSKGLFSIDGFLAQYTHGVYKYRVLGRWLYMQTHELISHINLSSLPVNATMKAMDPGFSIHAYVSYFLLNTVFLCMTCLTLQALLNKFGRFSTVVEKDFYISTLTCMTAITQFAVVPYDVMSYFFMCLGMYLILAGNQAWTSVTITSLLATVILATLSRETAALILSFHACIHVDRYGWKFNKDLRVLVLMVAGFLATYIGLRMALGTEQSTFQKITFHENISLKGFVGLAFFFSASALLIRDPIALRRAAIYLLFTAPYLGYVLVTGLLYEIRLWVPILLAIAVLATKPASHQHTVLHGH